MSILVLSLTLPFSFNADSFAAMMRGTPGDDDNLDGTEKDDAIYGLAGNDEIVGFDGNDAIFAGAGSDIVYGQDGNDYIEGNKGADVLHGEDFCNSNPESDDDEKDVIKGNQGDDVVMGESGDDTIYGNSGNDRLYGDCFNGPTSADGKDKLYGGMEMTH
jgi:Ca2+-binding RTX toxin-like protein